MKARTIVAAMAATILVTLSGGAAAQNYPKRPVEMVIPFGTGGAEPFASGRKSAVSVFVLASRGFRFGFVAQLR